TNVREGFSQQHRFPWHAQLRRERVAALRILSEARPDVVFIPSENASPARTEGFRCGTFKVSWRDPSTNARDDEALLLRRAHTKHFAEGKFYAEIAFLQS